MVSEADGLDAVARSIGVASVVAERPLLGGIAATTTLLRATDGDRFVLKRYPVARPDAASLEWDRLTAAQAAAVPKPRPVALDADGGWFGQPALVMSALDGEVDLRPRDRDAWVDQLASALAAIHSTTIVTRSGALERPHYVHFWDPDRASGHHAAVVATVVAHLQEIAANRPKVFCHADFHPGNVLFREGTLSGVVDWSSAKLAPAAADVAGTRADLALFAGVDAPDDFLAAYRRHANDAALDDLAWWDVLAADHAAAECREWADSFVVSGFPITADELEAAAIAHLDRCVERVAAATAT